MDNMLNFTNDKELLLVTHSGAFHADDVFATALLIEILEKNNFKYKILRTRDEDNLKNADIIYDVGGIYDPKLNMFDHHQKDDSLTRDNIPYSSFGLIWKHYGVFICGNDMELWNKLDENLVKPIDCLDNGIAISEDLFYFRPLNINVLMNLFNPTWVEEKNEDHSFELFMSAVKIARHIIERYVVNYSQIIDDSKKVVEIYENTTDKRVIVLDGKYNYFEALGPHEEILFVVSGNGDRWSIKSMPKKNTIFESKIYFPEEWRGLEGEELEKVTGVSGVIFCHKGGFLCVLNSKESAVILANKLLENV